MPSFRLSATYAIALAIAVGATLIVPRPAEAHGPNVKVTEDGGSSTGRYWDGTSGHPAPFYSDVTVHRNGTVTFWGTTICNGTIVYSDGAFNAYHNYQRIPINISDPIAQSNFFNPANGPKSGMYYDAQPAYCAQTARVPAKPSGTPLNVTDLRSIKSVFVPGFLVIMKSGQGYVFDLGTKFTFDVKNKQTSAITASGYSIALGSILLSGQLKGGQLISNDGATLIANNAAKLIGNDGSTLVGNDGSSLVGNDGSSLVGNDGSSFSRLLSSMLLKSPVVSNDGGSFSMTFSGLVGNDGSSLIGTGGSTLIGTGGSTLIGTGGSTLIGNADGTFNLTGVTAYRGLPSATIQQCDDNRISVAYALSGLIAPYALTASSHGKLGKCNPNVYVGGNYAVTGDRDGTNTVQALVPIIRASTDCYPNDPWIGEALWQAGIQRQAFANSCSPATYLVNGQSWSSFTDLVNRVKASYRVAQSGRPSGPPDKYGCIPPNYGVAMFPGNIFEAQGTPNLDTTKAISFRCSDLLPPNYTRPYPVPANLLIAVAPPPTPQPAPIANNAGIPMPTGCTSNLYVAIFDAKYPQYKGYFWYVVANPTLDLHKADPIICYSQIPKDAQGYGRRSGFANFGVPTALALGH